MDSSGASDHRIQRHFNTRQVARIRSCQSAEKAVSGIAVHVKFNAQGQFDMEGSIGKKLKNRELFRLTHFVTLQTAVSS